ncbi:MAG: methyltransferase domain-containing protein [Coleofasciculaceae cyanobacterium]
MIENTEINVEQLIQKIRNEVENNRKIYTDVETKPIDVSIRTNTTNISYIETLLNDADFYSQVPTEFPEKFNRFPLNLSKWLQKFFLKIYSFLFKKQRVVNSSLNQALKESLVLNQRLSDQINTLQEQLNSLNNRVTVTEGRLSETSYHFNATGERLTEIGGQCVASSEQLSKMSNHLNEMNNHLNEMNNHLIITDGRLAETKHHLDVANERITSINDRFNKNDSYLKNDLVQQKRLITMFLEEARQRLPKPFNSQQLQTFVNEEDHLLDAFYAAFEEQFRGSREDILSRLKVYLHLIKETKFGTSASPFLDLGCGRGEWLELLQNSGYAAQGLDINKAMIEQCRVRGLKVVETDALSYLRTLPDNSLGAVTGFHIIEHLPLTVLFKLLDETVRVLKTGGIAIFETPNPENILVSSHTFYLDPTHRHPLPSELSKFLLESKNLASVKVMNLHPYPDKFKLSGSDLAERFNQYFYGAQDYAVIGYKL